MVLLGIEHVEVAAFQRRDIIGVVFVHFVRKMHETFQVRPGDNFFDSDDSDDEEESDESDDEEEGPEEAEDGSEEPDDGDADK